MGGGIDPRIFEAATDEQRRELIAIWGQARITRLEMLQRVLVIVLSVVPILAIRACLEVVAGKSTSLNISVVATFSVAGLGALGVHSWTQHNKLVHARRRITKLENEVIGLRNENERLKAGGDLTSTDVRYRADLERTGQPTEREEDA